jgi:hypothetical protein
MADFAAHLPAIIAEAAKSPLGLLALMIISLSILGFYFFREASEKARIGIFVMLFLGVAAFGVSVARTGGAASASVEPPTAAGDRPGVDASSAGGEPSARVAEDPPVPLAGTWKASVQYYRNARTHDEIFTFKVDRDVVSGTAGFLGSEKGIQNARIEGRRVLFEVPWQEQSGDDIQNVRNLYAGTVHADRIDFEMQEDRGSPVWTFEARRVAEPR